MTCLPRLFLLLAEDEVCSSDNAGHDCSIIKGEMSFHSTHDSLSGCDYSDIIKYSMEGKDFSQVEGVNNIKYIESGSSCNYAGALESNEAQEESLGAGAMFGIAAAAAVLAALALLMARRLRNDKEYDTMQAPAISRDEISLVSVDSNFEGRFLGAVESDPFASTVDVHKCTSMYCNCNKGLSETTFIPAPRGADIKKAMKEMSGTSPQGVHEAENEFFPEEEPSPTDDLLDEVRRYAKAQDSTPDNIIRVNSTVFQTSPETHRSLSPVNEVSHDSEIDTEYESEGEDDDIPPPPPPPLPQNVTPLRQRQQRELYSLADSDEMSI